MSVEGGKTLRIKVSSLQQSDRHRVIIKRNVLQVDTDVSEENTASIFRVTEVYSSIS